MPAPFSGEQIVQLAALLEKNLSYRKIARVMDVSHPSVSFYGKVMAKKGLSSEYLTTLPDTEKQLIFHPNYPIRISKKAPIDAKYYIEKINKSGRKKGGYKAKHAYKEHLDKCKNDKNKAGSKSRFYKALSDESKAESKSLKMPQDYQPGEAFFSDFAGATIPYGKSDEFTAYIIVGVFGHSTFIKFGARVSQAANEWISFKQFCFYWAGGSTLLYVHDNGALVASARPDLKLNKTYQAFLRHFKGIAKPTPRKSPDFNALSEVSVKIFNTDVLPELQKMHFDTLEELNAELLKWEHMINDRILTGDSESRKTKFFRDEVPALRECPVKPFAVPLKVRRFKPPVTWVFKEDALKYRIPYRKNLKKVEVHIRKLDIEVFGDGVSLCVHTRRQRGEAEQINPSHLPPKYQKYYIEDQSHFVDWAETISQSTVELVNAQFNGISKPDFEGRANCIAINKIYKNKKVSLERFIEACEYVVSRGDTSVEALKRAIEKDISNPAISLRCSELLEQLHQESNHTEGEHHVH